MLDKIKKEIDLMMEKISKIYILNYINTIRNDCKIN